MTDEIPEQTQSGSRIEILRTTAEDAPTRDLLVLFGFVPLAMFVVFAIPQSVERFAYRAANPTVVDVYLSTFAHRSVLHLGENLGGYLLVTGLCYYYSLRTDWRSVFLTVFALDMVVVPPLTQVYAAQIAEAFDPFAYLLYTSVGFSNVLTALFAFLPALVGRHAQLEGDHSLDPSTHATLGILAASWWFTTRYFGLSTTAVTLSILVSAGIGFFCYRVATDWRTGSVSDLGAVRILFGWLLFIAAVHASFPAVAETTNVYGHYAGFLVGGLVVLAAPDVVAATREFEWLDGVFNRSKAER